MRVEQHGTIARDCASASELIEKVAAGSWTMTANTRWSLCMCVIGTAWLGCADDGAPSDTSTAGNPATSTAGSAAPSTAGSGAAGRDAATGGTTAPPDAAVPEKDAAGQQPTAPVPDAGPTGGRNDAEWTLLLEESWTLPAGGEVAQWCADVVIEEDTFISAIRPVHPPGTHHTTLSITPDQTPCTTAAVFSDGILYAAGVGTEALRMPEGVAMKLPAGHVLHLGLHLYNVGDEELAGVSGIEVIRVDPEDVEHEAELLVAGPLSLAIPPGRSTSNGTCTIVEDQTVFALFPHMHQLGVHLKTTATIGGQAMVLHDGPYDFEEQYQLPLEPLALRVGDTIDTACTYENTTGRMVTFGESSDTEMCFSVLFRYPATGNTICRR
jgi:Copper type II ascorbate-dependent monooxygenase, C-terminal domain